MIVGPEQTREIQQFRELLSKARLHQTVIFKDDSISVLVKADGAREVQVRFQGYRQTVWLTPYYFNAAVLSPLGGLVVALCTLPLYCPTDEELEAYIEYLNLWDSTSISLYDKTQLMQELAGTPYPDELHLRDAIKQHLSLLYTNLGTFD